MKSTIVEIASGIGALALCAAPLAAQEAEVAADAFARAEAAGIPVELLESKLEEGRAKGIPTDVVEAAIQRRADALVRASAAMEAAGVENASTADLSVGADALEGGVSEAVLQEISTSAPRERRAVAIAALSHLVAAGTVPEEALSRVEDALARGPEALANLSARAGVAADAVPAGVFGEGEVDGAIGTGGIPSDVPAGPPEGAGPPEDLPVP
ncbi:MAG: hypothetical protein ACODAA_01760 [Gemmatimonadota bacterium]